MCLEFCPSGCQPVFYDFLIQFIKLFLPALPCPVFTVSNPLLRRGKQIYLMEIFMFAKVHQILAEIPEIIFCQMVFVPGAAVTRTFHKFFRLDIKLSQAVDYDMRMDVAAAVISIQMGADQSLMSGEIPFGIFKRKRLRPFTRKAALCMIPGIKTDNIMVSFDFIIGLVFVV